MRSDFARALSALSSNAAAGGKKSKKKDAERDIYMDFEAKMKKLRKRRRGFRQMLYDGLNERKKLIESMKIQKAEEESLRRKLQKISAVDTHTTESSPRWWDFFTLFMIPAQIVTLIIFWIACDYDSTPNGNLGPVNRFVRFIYYFHYLFFDC